VTYFYNSRTGSFANESPPAAQYFILEADLHEGVGLHAYGSMQAMLADIQKNHWPPPNANAAAGNPGHPGTPSQALNAAGLGGIAAIGDFFNRLTQGNTWLRVGEVIAGLLLLYLGANALFRNTAVGDTVQSTTNKVRSVGKYVK
jgi:hypothetical protein